MEQGKIYFRVFGCVNLFVIVYDNYQRYVVMFVNLTRGSYRILNNVIMSLVRLEY